MRRMLLAMGVLLGAGMSMAGTARAQDKIRSEI